LYLNVYAPQAASPSTLKPVMFWLFGVSVHLSACRMKLIAQGNLAFGTGSLDFYNGDSLAVNEDVVVVTINYRTNSKYRVEMPSSKRRTNRSSSLRLFELA